MMVLLRSQGCNSHAAGDVLRLLPPWTFPAMSTRQLSEAEAMSPNDFWHRFNSKHLLTLRCAIRISGLKFDCKILCFTIELQLLLSVEFAVDSVL